MSKQQVKARLMDRLQDDRVLPPLPNTDNVIYDHEVALHTAKVRMALDGAKVIEATNVARYFETAYLDAHDPDAIWRDLKCVAPPYAKCFVEWDRPALIPGALRMGVLFASCTTDMIGPTMRSLMGRTTVSEETVNELRAKIAAKPHTKWVYFTLSFVEFPAQADQITNLRGPYHIGSACVDADGGVIDFSLQTVRSSVMSRNEEVAIGVSSLVGWTTLAMMNCENIETIEAIVPEAFQKARRKRGKKPLVSWHTVRVDMEKTPRSIQRTPLEGDGNVRLHEKRGHMKDYRKGRGLFGKYRGLWYWGPQLAGSGADGVVISDYKVE